MIFYDGVYQGEVIKTDYFRRADGSLILVYVTRELYQFTTDHPSVKLVCPD